MISMMNYTNRKTLSAYNSEAEKHKYCNSKKTGFMRLYEDGDSL